MEPKHPFVEEVELLHDNLIGGTPTDEMRAMMDSSDPSTWTEQHKEWVAVVLHLRQTLSDDAFGWAMLVYKRKLGELDKRMAKRRGHGNAKTMFRIYFHVEKGGSWNHRHYKSHGFGNFAHEHLLFFEMRKGGGITPFTDDYIFVGPEKRCFVNFFNVNELFAELFAIGPTGFKTNADIYGPLFSKLAPDSIPYNLDTVQQLLSAKGYTPRDESTGQKSLIFT